MKIYKKSFSFFIFFIGSFILYSSSAFAGQKAKHCIDLIHKKSGDIIRGEYRLKNKCNYPVNVSYCFTRPHRDGMCGSGSSYYVYLQGIPAGSQSFIAFNNGVGVSINIAACRDSNPVPKGGSGDYHCNEHHD